MHVVTLGEIVVDWLSLTPGETILSACNFYRALGGNSTNVAIGLRRLGAQVDLVGKVGVDFHADYLRAALAAEHLSLDYVIADKRYPTAQCYMTTTADGQHHFRNWPQPHAADMLSVEDLPAALLARADIVHSTGISMVNDPRRAAVMHALDVAAAAGAIISFDAGFPSTASDVACDLVRAVLSKAHLLKVNEFELRYWTKTDASEDRLVSARRMFEEYRPVALLLTLAGEGSVIVWEHGTVECPPLPVQAISEVGAGDAYVAGAIYWVTRLLSGASGDRVAALRALQAPEWRQVGLSGNAAGALTTLKHNAYEGMPDRQELLKAMGVLSPGSA